MIGIYVLVGLCVVGIIVGIAFDHRSAEHDEASLSSKEPNV